MNTPERMMSFGQEESNKPSDEGVGRLERWEKELNRYAENIPHHDTVIKVIIEEAETIAEEIQDIEEQTQKEENAEHNTSENGRLLQDSLDKKYAELRSVIDRAKARADEGADERDIDRQRKHITLRPPFGTARRQK